MPDKATRNPVRPDDPGPPQKPAPADLPAAGPHAKPGLTNPDSTPGTGALPDPAKRREGDAGTG
jgi:hypothetical protein